jgi:hypothetical protein
VKTPDRNGNERFRCFAEFGLSSVRAPRARRINVSSRQATLMFSHSLQKFGIVERALEYQRLRATLASTNCCWPRVLASLPLALHVIEQ